MYNQAAKQITERKTAQEQVGWSLKIRCLGNARNNQGIAEDRKYGDHSKDDGKRYICGEQDTVTGWLGCYGAVWNRVVS